MTATLQEGPAFLREPIYLPRVTKRDGRAIEEALAGPNLFDPGVSLSATVVEASYAVERSPLLKRLRETHVAQIIEPQTLRFTGRRFLEVAHFESLPYTPAAPIEADSFTDQETDALARDVLLFQQDHDAACFLTASLPYYDRDFQRWLRLNDRLLSAACNANGTGDLDRRPVIAHVAPGRVALANPELIVNRLADYPIDAVYVEALRLNPVRDSIEKLTQYLRFLLAIRDQGLPVIAARVGAFGLVLQALGIMAFDSGLAQAEASNLAALNRPSTPRKRKGRGGGDRRIYLEPLKTTLTGRHAAAVLGNRALSSRFICSLGCCQHRGFDDLAARGRQHYLWARDHEVAELRACPTLGLRRDLVHERLRDAREHARLVRRALLASTPDMPLFAHIDRWIAVLGADARMPAIA